MGGIIYWLIIGLIAGVITGKVMGAPNSDLLATTITGLVGAIVGYFLMSLLGFAGTGGMIRNVIVAVLGAMVVTWAYRKMRARAV